MSRSRVKRFRAINPPPRIDWSYVLRELAPLLFLLLGWAIGRSH